LDNTELEFMSLLIAVFMGLCGGILNLLVRTDSISMPHFNKGQNGSTLYFGFLRELALGVGAAIIAWGLIDRNLVSERNLVAICLIAATGGASYITSVMQSRQIKTLKETSEVDQTKIKKLNEISKLAVSRSATKNDSDNDQNII